MPSLGLVVFQFGVRFVLGESGILALLDVVFAWLIYLLYDSGFSPSLIARHTGHSLSLACPIAGRITACTVACEVDIKSQPNPRGTYLATSSTSLVLDPKTMALSQNDINSIHQTKRAGLPSSPCRVLPLLQLSILLHHIYQHFFLCKIGPDILV